MADSIFKRAGEALGISKRGIPTEAIGTSTSTAPIAGGDGAGTFDEPDRGLNIVGQRRFDEFDRMVRDVAIVGAGVRLFLNLISNAVWTVNPPEGLNDNEQAVAQGYADEVYAGLFAMTTSWSSIVRKTASYKLHGFCIQEWTAKVNPDGTIGLLDIEHRPQRSITRWLRDPSGTIEAVIQRVPGRPDATIPRSKLVYAVDDTLSDSPEGVGLFRHMALTSARLELFQKLEEIGFTTDLRGIPIARAPLNELREQAHAAGADGTPARNVAEARRSALLAPLHRFLDKHVRNEKTGMLFSSETYMAQGTDRSTTVSSVPKWSLELLNGDSHSFEAMSSAINRLNQELARILGVEHLLLGSDGGGSLALARSKVGTFYLTVTSSLLDLCEIYDRDLIAPLAELNGWPEEMWPQMGVNEISDRDVDQLLEGLAKLATAGAPVMPDDPAVGEIYDLWGLTRPPERVDEEDLSLNPNRNAPAREPKADPDGLLANNPEDGLTKRRAKVLRSRRNMAKRARARRA